MRQFGVDLRTWLHQNRPVSVTQASTVLARLAAELDALHARGGRHGPLDATSVQISDGQSDTPTVHLTEARPAGGDPAGSGTSNADDQRALGALVREMFTGTEYGRISQVRPELPPGLDELIDRAQSPDPAARFGTCGAFAHEVITLLHPATQTHPMPQVPGPGTDPGAPGGGIQNPSVTPTPRTPSAGIPSLPGQYSGPAQAYPSGPLPSGPLPSGPLPSGPMSSGSMSSGSMPSGPFAAPGPLSSSVPQYTPGPLPQSAPMMSAASSQPGTQPMSGPQYLGQSGGFQQSPYGYGTGPGEPPKPRKSKTALWISLAAFVLAVVVVAAVLVIKPWGGGSGTTESTTPSITLADEPTDCTYDDQAVANRTGDLKQGQISIPAASLPTSTGWQGMPTFQPPYSTRSIAVGVSSRPQGNWMAGITIGEMNRLATGSPVTVARSVIGCLPKSNGYANVGPSTPEITEVTERDFNGVPGAIVKATIRTSGAPAGITGDDVIVLIVSTSPKVFAVATAAIGDSRTYAEIESAINAVKITPTTPS
ncbi:hypothetical protein GII30_11445 [Gordonia amarae]|uniref:Uncharacterized protein n=1 Tax=Gordonia amarae TaxID=36821 RepID=A0A857LLW1_9ACTN|nr:hypothetical protein [Gordonia amarae]MCS3878997.1 hypothetical protein [Gordonia amarae]QHN17541.1 hypothetical protein GII35_11655 [Gordonia amarae]QHN22067.1 hypothetical protein GII34_11435 [Gordonia amarae]QHN30948.1 hypothetical protein GII32_11610 [Gordonia amarae]QHN39694.1 hypothetical protein GII30_11445 [Gordonia amarae]